MYADGDDMLQPVIDAGVKCIECSHTIRWRVFNFVSDREREREWKSEHEGPDDMYEIIAESTNLVCIPDDIGHKSLTIPYGLNLSENVLKLINMICKY